MPSFTLCPGNPWKWQLNVNKIESFEDALEAIDKAKVNFDAEVIKYKPYHEM